MKKILNSFKKVINVFGLTTQRAVVLLGVFVIAGSGVAYATFYRSGVTPGFLYGYGYGFTDGFGYGYGYESGTDADGEYGFFGDSGVATSISANATKTTVAVTYSNDYLAKNQVLYGTSTPLVPEVNTTETSLSDYQTGEQTITITGLTCDTQYYFMVVSLDAGLNSWTSDEQDITTDPCGSRGGGGSVGNTSNTLNNVPVPVNPNLGQGKTPYIGPDGKVIMVPRVSLVMPLIKRDMRGPFIRDLQIILNRLGFIVSSTGPGSSGHETNFFGPKTKAALMKFQKAYGLIPDGVYGPKTAAFMISLFK